MRLSKTKGMFWSLMVSVIILAMPMWVLADDAGAPNIEQIKQLRQLQNQSTIVKNLKANSNQVNASENQERMLRLSQALSKVTKGNTPQLERTYNLGFNRQEVQVPQVQMRETREVVAGSGILSSTPGFEYFNFLTGLNSPDSIGMDVRITGNEGTNFGNEGASWGDPSLLHFLSPDSLLDDIMDAPMVDDPAYLWTNVSWDANDYQPLAVGNIWVVYARTSHMYIALEVTYVAGGTAYFEFNYMIQTDGSNYFEDDDPGSIIYRSAGMWNRPDSLFFNFYTGELSNDTLDTDVRCAEAILGGTGFGTGDQVDDLGNWYPAHSLPQSLIYNLSPMGSLDTVSIVPTIDEGYWANGSWDENFGDGHSPLMVGELWVVYTRTTNMYVVMEITYVSPGVHENLWFTFDYMIQTDGSNLFDGGYVEPEMLDMTVNGVYSESLEIGSNPYFEITLDTEPYGEVVVFWDGNHNGTFDDADVPIESYEFMDNDMHDEDPADGIFGFTYTDEMADGINYLADDLLFVAFGTMDIAEVAVTFYSVPTDYSVSGYVYLGVTADPPVPLEGIVVWASYPDMNDDGPDIIGVTDVDGYYHLDLPDSGFVVVGSEDHFYMTDGLMPVPHMHEVLVMGHETGFDFMYVEPNSMIQGYVYDETGLALADIEVAAHTDGPGFSTFTDETGFYNMGVMPGYYTIEIAWWSLTMPYMLPFQEDVIVEDGDIIDLDLYVHNTNSQIIGSVLVDGVPYADASVYAMHPDIGYSATFSDSSGNFFLPVFDDGGTVYDIGAHIEDAPNVIQVSENWDVPAGTVGEMILFETLNGGLHGYFINGETGEPIMEAWEVGMSIYDINTDLEYWAGPHPDGYYEMWVPDGLYEVMVAGGMNWYMDGVDTVLVDGAQVEYDVILWPVGFDTFFEGNVYNNLGSPIMDAEVMIGNPEWGASTFTDGFGFYHFDVPAGYYGVGVMAEGYYDQYDEVDLTEGPQFYDFYMEPFEVNGAIGGIVFDLATGSPLADTEVFVYSPEMAYSYYTDPSGEFWFDLPNGIYGLYVEHPDFIPFWIDDIPVENDTLYFDVPMAMPDGGIEGYIRDGISGEIINNADIGIFSLTDSMAFWAHTDEFGYYSIAAMNGTYDVIVNAPGYETSVSPNMLIQDEWVQLDINLDQHEFATSPEINFIIDQPNDQGRQVRMQFWPGGTEWGPFMGYSVWRLTNTPMGEIFDFVDYLPNHDFEAYNLVLPTLVDSNAYNQDPENYLSLFMVTGHFDMYGYIDGMPAAGYSIDNIVPGIPGPLALLSSGETGVEIGWEASMADDFQYFEIYRADNSDFTDASVFASVDPLFLDEDVTVGETYYYMVSALDANGNASEGTNVITTSIVSIEDTDAMPTAFGLSQNYPNPFNPTTSIEFALPEASNVTLEIYNLLGQKVRTLVNGYTPAGYITTSWNGLDQNGKELSSGTYIYRLETADMSFAKKMVLMK